MKMMVKHLMWYPTPNVIIWFKSNEAEEPGRKDLEFRVKEMWLESGFTICQLRDLAYTPGVSFCSPVKWAQEPPQLQQRAPVKIKWGNSWRILTQHNTHSKGFHNTASGINISSWMKWPCACGLKRGCKLCAFMPSSCQLQHSRGSAPQRIKSCRHGEWDNPASLQGGFFCLLQPLQMSACWYWKGHWTFLNFTFSM